MEREELINFLRENLYIDININHGCDYENVYHNIEVSIHLVNGDNPILISRSDDRIYDFNI